jgi:myo-inositol 2-dehydrogenase / D-chiro-inositol 1-dehydrogenase
MASTRLAVVGGGDRARHHVHQVYTVRDREYPFSAEDQWSIVGEAAYEKHAPDPPSWTQGISDLDPEVTAVFDPDKAARKRLGQLCVDKGDDPTLYDSFQALVDNGSFDAVIVASPNFAHLEQATALLERGIDTFCEKPIGLTLAEHDLLIEADDRSDGLFFVGFNLRSHPVYTKISELIDDGTIGKLGMITSHNVRVPFPPGFRYSDGRSGGTLLEKNCHDFDLYNWYIGADPVRVAAIGGQRVLSKETDTIDHATTIVEYENGVKATLELSLFSPFTQGRHRSYFVRGDDGIIRTPEEAGTLDLFNRTTASRIQTRPNAAGGEANHGGADYRQMIRFLRCLQGDAIRPASPNDAKKAAAVAIAAQESIKHGPFYRIDDEYNVKPE